MFDIWKNGACLGYIIAALEDLNYRPSEIQRVVDQIQCGGFNTISVEEADGIYCSRPY